ncbi:MAG: heme-copper oxidase subunit III [Actinobacteria bacterium]|nr:heme-copper oxidase subunit III [Actinomycetota bacterium]MBO0786935.1 heme-copper oxidase subunit III [Actinomycetota bacterium]
MTTNEPVAGSPAPELLDQQAVRSASSSVTGMVLFVASEAVFFAAFLGIWATSYASVRTWPPAGLAGPGLVVPTIGVVVLLASGAAVAQAMRLAHAPGSPRGLTAWLAAGLGCAVVFGVLLAIGYADIPFGVGQGIYQSLFYMIIGLELAHVVGGAVLLAVVLVRASTGELALRRDPVQSAAIYWYFVVGLGAVIYAVLYLGAIR